MSLQCTVLHLESVSNLRLQFIFVRSPAMTCWHDAHARVTVPRNSQTGRFSETVHCICVCMYASSHMSIVMTIDIIVSHWRHQTYMWTHISQTFYFEILQTSFKSVFRVIECVCHCWEFLLEVSIYLSVYNHLYPADLFDVVSFCQTVRRRRKELFRIDAFRDVLQMSVGEMATRLDEAQCDNRPRRPRGEDGQRSVD